MVASQFRPRTGARWLCEIETNGASAKCCAAMGRSGKSRRPCRVVRNGGRNRRKPGTAQGGAESSAIAPDDDDDDDEDGVHDYTAADDVREIYWDPNATSTYNQKQGAFVETDHQRYRQGQIPAGPPQIPVPQ